MSKPLVRYSYHNTGVRGTPIDKKKSKYAIAFTAERDAEGVQHVSYGISVCHPNDDFVRAVGRQIAEARLELAATDSSAFWNTITLPKEVNLDEIPAKILEQHKRDNADRQEVMNAETADKIKRVKAISAELEAAQTKAIADLRLKYGAKHDELMQLLRDLSPESFDSFEDEPVGQWEEE